MGFFTEINRLGTTIILTTHYLEEAESLCRNIAIIDQGELVENTSTSNLLKTLKKETYILDLAEPIEKLPANLPKDWLLKNSAWLEVEVPKNDGINAVFQQLDQHNIKVRSMRNKTNRLEQLFLDMVKEEKTA